MHRDPLKSKNDYNVLFELFLSEVLLFSPAQIQAIQKSSLSDRDILLKNISDRTCMDQKTLDSRFFEFERLSTDLWIHPRNIDQKLDFILDVSIGDRKDIPMTNTAVFDASKFQELIDRLKSAQRVICVSADLKRAASAALFLRSRRFSNVFAMNENHV